VPSAASLAEGLLVALPHEGAAALAEDLGVVRVSDALSARLSSLRALVPLGEPFRISPAYRRWRGRTAEEPLGGASALAVLEGMGHVMLGSAANRRLMPVQLADEFLYLRESVLVAFEASLRYENGRLVKNDGTAIPMVQLSGKGYAVFETKQTPRALEVHGPHGVTVEADSVIGWTGRLVPGSSRVEPVAGIGGLVTFSGDGALLLVSG
jgi:hypothetical protein